jgi:SAM-dependent methyltransferase
MDLDALKANQSAAWGQGEYAPLSELLRPAAEALCDACAVSAGQEVLDVAAGDGNFALACAAEGASVVASDISPAMVAQGRARAEAEGFDVEWLEADVEALPFEDARFDCVGSVFGAMIAPRPEVAARELFRVVRPGNTVGMTAWTPDSFASSLFAIGRSYVPPPPDVPLGHEWGVEETARERFDGLAGSFTAERRTLLWEAETPAALIDRFAAAGPMDAMAKKSLSPDRYEALRGEMVELVAEWGGQGPVRIENEYLLIVARKRG